MGGKQSQYTESDILTAMNAKSSRVWCHTISTICIYAFSGPLIPDGFPQFQFISSFQITYLSFPPQLLRSEMSEMMPQDYEDSTCSQMETKIWSSVPAGTGHMDRLTDRPWVINRVVLGLLVYPKDGSSNLFWNVFTHLAKCMVSQPNKLSL
jgi:hypothetical protein